MLYYPKLGITDTYIFKKKYCLFKIFLSLACERSSVFKINIYNNIGLPNLDITDTYILKIIVYLKCSQV
jgi:hypothetical protein